MSVHDFTIGQRVQLHPATDLWMRGARYGQVTRTGRKWVTVQLDRTGQHHRIHPDNLMTVDDAVRATFPNVDPSNLLPDESEVLLSLAAGTNEQHDIWADSASDPGTDESAHADRIITPDSPEWEEDYRTDPYTRESVYL